MKYLIIFLLSSNVLASEVTYKTITPILKNHCSNCHNDRWQDKNWDDYDTAKLFSQKIKNRVWELKNMPPGNFTGMTDKEREVIKNWVDQGSKK